MTLSEYLESHTQDDLARRVGVTQGLVHQWLHGKTKITAERAIAIELATNKAITRQELRPDIWPELVKAA